MFFPRFLSVVHVGLRLLPLLSFNGLLKNSMNARMGLLRVHRFRGENTKDDRFSNFNVLNGSNSHRQENSITFTRLIFCLHRLSTSEKALPHRTPIAITRNKILYIRLLTRSFRGKLNVVRLLLINNARARRIKRAITLTPYLRGLFLDNNCLLRSVEPLTFRKLSANLRLRFLRVRLSNVCGTCLLPIFRYHTFLSIRARRFSEHLNEGSSFNDLRHSHHVVFQDATNANNGRGWGEGWFR